MNDPENLIKIKKNKEEPKESEENLKYYTTIYKVPKYLEKVNL